MPRNDTWLWHGFDAQGKLIGELEGNNARNALDEFSYEYPDSECIKVTRVKGSGKPPVKMTPMAHSELAIRAIHKATAQAGKMLDALAAGETIEAAMARCMYDPHAKAVVEAARAFVAAGITYSLDLTPYQREHYWR